MESIIAQNEDVLVQPLDFSLGASAQYCLAREQQMFFSSQNLVSPSSVKVAKFQLGGNGFYDLSWLYFAFDYTNNHVQQP